MIILSAAGSDDCTVCNWYRNLRDEATGGCSLWFWKKSVTAACKWRHYTNRVAANHKAPFPHPELTLEHKQLQTKGWRLSFVDFKQNSSAVTYFRHDVCHHVDRNRLPNRKHNNNDNDDNNISTWKGWGGGSHLYVSKCDHRGGWWCWTRGVFVLDGLTSCVLSLRPCWWRRAQLVPRHASFRLGLRSLGSANSVSLSSEPSRW